VSYSTRMDDFMLASTILVFASLLAVVASTRLARTDRIKAAGRIDRWGRRLYPVLFAGIIVWTLVV